MRGWLLVALCACRINFDDVRGELGDARSDGSADVGAVTTVTFGERPTSQRKNVTSDAFVGSLTPMLNFGGTEDLSLAEFTMNSEHTLLRFDLSSIAAGSSVAGARLHVTRLDYGDETPGPIEVRLLGEGFVEGTNMGAPGTGVSWATRDGSAAWVTPGGTTAGTLATLTPTSDDIMVTLDAQLVQSWVDNPTTNLGVLFTVGLNTAHFHLHSRNSTVAAARPELAIDLQ
jgi:hypothetical protein